MKAKNAGDKNAIDRLYRVRAERKILQEEERQLGEALKKRMQQNGWESLETDEHQVVLESRSGGPISPLAFFKALGRDFKKFISAVSVRKETKDEKLGADYYLSKEAIEAITKQGESSVALRVKKLPANVKQTVQPKAKANKVTAV
jgi:hypothetical protein